MILSIIRPLNLIITERTTTMINLNKEKIIDSLLNDPLFKSIVDNLGLKINPSSAKITKVQKQGNATEATIVFNDTGNPMYILMVKCIIGEDSRVEKVLSVAPVVKSVINQSLSIPKAEELVKNISVLKKIYHDPRVHKLMMRYNISFNNFVEAYKSIGLIGTANYSALSIQIIVYKIKTGNRTIYLVDRPGIKRPEDNGICPLVDIIDIQFIIINNTIEITRTDVIHDTFDPKCFTGSEIPAHNS